MKSTLAKLGLLLAGLVVLMLFAWGTRFALRPVAHGMASYYYDLGVRKQRAGNLDGAIGDYNRAIALDSKYTGAYVNRGLAKATQGRIDEAIADYDRAIAINPGEYSAYFNRARAKLFQRDLQAALVDFDRALELHSTNAFALCGRSEVKIALGDLAGATQDADRAMKLQPNGAAFNARARVKTSSGDLAGAKADFTRSIELDPQYAWSYAGRGSVAYMSRNWSETIKDYRHVCELSETERDYPHLFIWLARTRQGEADEANKELAAYLEERQSSKAGDWPATVAKFLLGDVTEAGLFAAAKSPDSKKEVGQLCEAWYYAGEKKMLHGDKDSAASYFQKCLDTKQRDYVEYDFAKAELKDMAATGEK